MPYYEPQVVRIARSRYDDVLTMLEPLPYHKKIRNYLKNEEPEVWEWYATNRADATQADAIRFDLLKSTYRLERDSESDLYAAAGCGRDKAFAGRAGYHLSGAESHWAERVARVSAGRSSCRHSCPLTAKLTDAELRALLGHELSHFALWSNWNGDYLIVDQILAAMTHDRMPRRHTLRRRDYGRSTNEILCDVARYKL